MKRLAILLTAFLFSFGFVRAQLATGASMTAYSLTKTDTAYRNLTEGATTLTTLPDTLNHKFVLSFEKDTLVPVPIRNPKGLGSWDRPRTARQACIALPKEMMFGREPVRHVGITTDGFLFFGETVVPTFIDGDNSISYHMASQKSLHFVYFSLVDLLDGKFKGATPLCSGDNTRIGYETVGDMLYIAYENVIIGESGTESQTVSWNYQINTATGEISLQTKGFYSGDAAYPTRNLAYGLVGSKQSDDIWLSELSTSGSASPGWVVFCPVNKDSLTEGSLFTFSMPEPCVRVENPVLDWHCSATENTISLNGTTWEAANKAIFVLSTSESAPTDSRPEDGKEYGNGVVSLITIGSNKGLVAEIRADGSVKGLGTSFTKLTEETDYWINAYVYASTCSNGPLYSDPVVRKVNTSMLAPAQDKIALGDFTTGSIKLTLGEPAAGRSYVVAVSKVPLGDSYGRISYNLLRNGRTYSAGDQVGEAVVRYSKVGAGTYTIDELAEGTVYRVYVWLSKGEAEDIEYSAAYCEVIGQTTMVAPTTVDFNGYAAGDSPAGWLMTGFDEGSSAYMVSEYSGRGDGLLSAKTPTEGTNVLYAAMSYAGNASLPQKVHTSAVTPVILKGGIDNISTTFNFGFYTTGNGITVCTLKDEDSVVVSWAASQDAENWNRLGAITSATQLDASGFVSLPLPAFIPDGEGFCFKIDAYLLVKSGDDALGIAIESIVLEEERPCKYPVNIAVPKESISKNTAVVSWEDANLDPAQGFAVRYRAEGQEEWLRDSSDEERITLKNLSPSTLYTVMVQALCGTEKGASIERAITFKTGLVFPYSYIPDETGELPENCAQYRGKPGETLKGIGTGDDCRWNLGRDALDEGYVLVNRLQQNPDAWLMFPVVNADMRGTVRVKIDLSAWGFEMMEGDNPQEALKTHDSLWVFVSETGDFHADRTLLGCVDIDSLHYKTKMENGGETVVYDSVAFDFEVYNEKSYTLALYVPAKTADITSSDLKTILAVSSVEMVYVDIIYPAVTDLHTTGLKKDSVTINWKGEADEYRLFWKERASEGEYNEVGTKELSYTITGLKPKTQYAYYVYGIYGGKEGLASEVQYFRTLSDDTPIELDTVATPDFDTPSGEVESGTIIKITCATDNATIYYTTDGSTPTGDSKRYVMGVTVNRDMTIKAIAIKEGMENSKVAEAAYTVKVANEGDVLAAVKLYPNPTDGLFHVVVPEAATVEVFSASGTLVERLNVAAGQTALRLNQSGMYFVKVSIGNQFAIRKVAVR